MAARGRAAGHAGPAGEPGAAGTGVRRFGFRLAVPAGKCVLVSLSCVERWLPFPKWSKVQLRVVSNKRIVGAAGLGQGSPPLPCMGLK